MVPELSHVLQVFRHLVDVNKRIILLSQDDEKFAMRTAVQFILNDIQSVLI